MLNMVRADFYRVFQGKKFKLCLLFTFVWVISCALLQEGTVAIRETFAGLKINIDYWNSFWGYHPVMIPLITFCCMEFITDFKQKTIKLYVAKGISKWSFLFSKIFMGWIAAFAFVVVALFAGIICDVIMWGGNLSAFLSINFIGYLLEYGIAHATAATFIISIIFLMRGNGICSVINLLLLIYGYFILNKMELAMGQNELITRFWVYSNIGSIEMGNLARMLPEILLLFALYFIVFGLFSGVIFNRLDIE